VIAEWFARLDPPPDVFAIVMASGIVSTAAGDHGYWRISTGLIGVALVSYIMLGTGFVVRVSTSPVQVMRLARDPDVALRMFTFVSASTVLGAHRLAVGPARSALAVLAVAGWLVLGPLAAVDVRSRSAAQLRDHAHGAWLLPSVATSGLAIICGDLAGQSGLRIWLALACVGWVIAVVMYGAVAGLVVWRLARTRLRPASLGPDSWILMGALAICALAGGHIHAALRAIDGPPLLASVAGGMILGPLVLASAWIPLLLVAEMWRVDHVVGALRYHRAWWSAVFPVGMYAATTAQAAHELGLPALHTVSLVFFWNALTLWVMVTAGLVHTTVTRPQAPASEGC
jgi:tellurite resistance protein TehA-like permease